MNYVDTRSAALNAPARAIRVFVAEDHQITLWGLHRLIDASSVRMEVVGTASSRNELLNHDAAATADVILLDLDLGGEDAASSLACLRQRCPGRILILTASDNPEQHRAAMIKGASGVIHKSAPAETILRAIEKVNNGEVWLDRALLGEVLGMLTNDSPTAAPRQADPDAQRIASLTAREREIVVTMVHRAGAKQLAVADELNMSEHTLRNHLTTIYSKLGVRGRLELHVFSTTHGLGAATGRRENT
ncbi:response regulator transcription factor [Rhodoferax ferrireducens]|uniref:response regulator transcription factor n=1 Tax=Rhodoferax ferrireducens TaxID=192843 RepID=UPI000E0CF62D|nr:response regulator transcription factor [Rhodoferax ferrireducens]